MKYKTNTQNIIMISGRQHDGNMKVLIIPQPHQLFQPPEEPFLFYHHHRHQQAALAIVLFYILSLFKLNFQLSIILSSFFIIIQF